MSAMSPPRALLCIVLLVAAALPCSLPDVVADSGATNRDMTWDEIAQAIERTVIADAGRTHPDALVRHRIQSLDEGVPGYYSGFLSMCGEDAAYNIYARHLAGIVDREVDFSNAWREPLANAAVALNYFHFYFRGGMGGHHEESRVRALVEWWMHTAPKDMDDWKSDLRRIVLHTDIQDACGMIVHQFQRGAVIADPGWEGSPAPRRFDDCWEQCSLALTSLMLAEEHLPEHVALYVRERMLSYLLSWYTGERHTREPDW